MSHESTGPVKLSEISGYWRGPVNIGFVLTDEGAVLIDTGIDRTAPRRLAEYLKDALGSRIVAVLNTHAHADHFGGNSYVVSKFDATVCAPPVEAEIIRSPVLEPLYLAGGKPPAELMGKFIMGEASPVHHVVTGPLRIGGIEFDPISLPGHSINQVGYMIDRTFFCADVLFPEEIIKKYGLLYCYDPASHLETLHKLKEIEAGSFIPGHGKHQEGKPEKLLEINRKHFFTVEEIIIGHISQPRHTEGVLNVVLEKLKLSLQNYEQYYLCLSTIKGYLQKLKEEGRAECKLRDGGLMWKSIK